MSRATLDRDATYREAARLIADGREYAACRAIALAITGEGWTDLMHGEHVSYINAFEDVFEPERAEHGPYWWDPYTEDGRCCRIVALCMMAAMVEAGDA